MEERGFMISNLGIRTKILGLVLIILLIMTITSGISTYYISKVKDELHTIAIFLVPITQQLTQAEVHILEQEIKFETILEEFESKNIDLNKREKLIDDFNKIGLEIGAEIDRGKALAIEGLKSATGFELVSGFSKMIQSLNMINEGHKNFEKHGAEIIDLLLVRKYDYAHLLENWMEEEEDKLNSLLEKALIDIERLTEFAAIEAENHQKLLQVLMWSVTASAVIIGLVLSVLISGRMVRPIKGLLQASRKLSEGEFDTLAPITSQDEIGQLARDFNEMLINIRQKERIRSTFGQYVDPRVINSLMGNYDFEEVKSTEATVFFSDIVGFSRISEQFTADAMVRLINEYLSDVSEPISIRQGIIDKIIGDAIVAFWCPPFTEVDEGAIKSCISALDQQNKVAIFKNKISEITGLKKYVPNIKVRMGIATGDCLLGNIGSKRLKSFTTIGPVTEWAEKLESLNKEYNTEILVSGRTFELAKSRMEFRKIEKRVFPGVGEIDIFELLGPIDAVPKERLLFRDNYEKSLSLFQKGEFGEALVWLEDCRERMPGDGAVSKYIELSKNKAQ